MFDKLDGIEERHGKLEKLLSDPDVLKDRKAFEQYAREHSELSAIVNAYREQKQILEDIEGSKELLKDDDPDIKEMAKEDLNSLQEQYGALENEIKGLLMPKDPNDGKNVIVEIRAGTGGEEAGLFAGDLFRMYARFAETSGWKIDILSQHQTGVGGFKEVIALFNGKNVYSRMKYESGTHRVQRVPTTEAQGRIHTSAVTVAVLPEAEEVDVDIEPSEIKVDFYRATGPGGQSVNTTDSAVRLTHIPTSLVVTCQDEKSQHKNKAKAMKVLRARLMDQIQAEQDAEISKQRRSQVGTGDRSQRIRTYNFPQGRLTDHRIGLTLYKLESILQGDITELIDSCATHFQAVALQEAEVGKASGATLDNS